MDAIWGGGGLFDGNGRAGLPEAMLFEAIDLIGTEVIPQLALVPTGVSAP